MRKVDWDNLSEDDKVWARQANRGHLIPQEDSTADEAQEPAEDTDADAQVEESEYEDWTKGDLIEEINERNEGLPEDEQMPTSGKKAQLIALLEADDAASD